MTIHEIPLIELIGSVFGTFYKMLLSWFQVAPPH